MTKWKHNKKAPFTSAFIHFLREREAQRVRHRRPNAGLA